MLIIDLYKEYLEQLDATIEDLSEKIDANHQEMDPDCSQEAYILLSATEEQLLEIRRLKRKERQIIKDKIEIAEMLNSRNGDPEEWILRLAYEEDIVLIIKDKHYSALHVEVKEAGND